MAKTLLLYRLDTGAIDGNIHLSNNDDVRYYPENPNIHSFIEIKLEHPALSEQQNWHVVNGALIRKNDAEIAQIEEAQRQRRQPSRDAGIEALLLAEINELRTAMNLPTKTLADVRGTPLRER